MSQLIGQEPNPESLDRLWPEAHQPLPGGFYKDEGEPISLGHYYRLILRRKWLILAAVFTAVAGAAIYVQTATPLYTSTATIQIDPEDPKFLPYEVFSESEASRGGIKEYLLTQRNNLTSRALSRRVVERLNLAENPAFVASIKRGSFSHRSLGLIASIRGLLRRPKPNANEENDKARVVAGLVGRLGRGLEVSLVPDTRLVQVSHTSPDPEIAAKVVNTLVEQFIQQHFESKYDATKKATQFIQRQLLQLKIQVEKSEESLLSYARANNIFNINERQSINQKKLADLSDEMTRLESELFGQQARYEVVKEATVGRFPQSLKNETIRDLELRLSELLRKLGILSTRFLPEWPAVKELRMEIQKVKQQVIEEKREAIDRAKLEYQITLDRYRRVSDAVDEQRIIVDGFNENSIQYNILKREVDTNKDLYDGLLQRLKEAGVAAGLKSSNIRIADAAEVPLRPSSPRKGRTLRLALILGAFVGVGLALLLEAMDSTVKTTEDVTQLLGLPSLGLIPTIRSATKLHARNRQLDAKVVWQRSRAEPMRYRVSEAYRSLRTSMLLSHSGEPPQTIMVTSALPREGKTTTAANMGIVLAQTGAPTLLLDLDMRRPDLDVVFGICAKKGVSNYLRGNSDLLSLIRATEFPNLFLAPVGPLPPNPAELLSSHRMRSALHLLKDNFTYIVIDTPPFLEITDALVLCPLVDGVVVVTQGGKTPKEAVRRASERLRQVGGKILGVVLNNVDLRTSDCASYYGHYRSYYDTYFSSSRSSKKSA